jgi:hypothetical protein
MAPETVPVAYFMNPSHKSVLRVCPPPIVARQRICIEYPSSHCYVKAQYPLVRGDEYTQQ